EPRVAAVRNPRPERRVRVHARSRYPPPDLLLEDEESSELAEPGEIRPPPVPDPGADSFGHAAPRRARSAATALRSPQTPGALKGGKRPAARRVSKIPESLTMIGRPAAIASRTAPLADSADGQ